MVTGTYASGARSLTQVTSVQQRRATPQTRGTQGEGVNAVPSPIDLSELISMLSSYGDKSFIISGFREGFRLGFKGPFSSTQGRNSRSVRLNPEATAIKVAAECNLNRIAGPFEVKPFSPFKCSPLSLRPKQTPGKYRLLHDLSAPYNRDSVNAGIDDIDAKVKYTSVIRAIECLDTMEGAFMAKADLKDAYRQVPLAPDQYWLVGFKLESRYYHDLRLPMGARSSCAIFERIASALEFILRDTYKVKHIFKMLDDFLFIAPSKEECAHGLWAFEDLCHKLNLPLAEEKTVSPAREVVFLGIHLDTAQKQASVPVEKAQRYAQQAHELARKKIITLGQLRELTGKLEHATCIIKGGRAFLRRLHDAKQGPQKSSRFLKVTDPMRRDLELWCHFLKNFNARTLFSLVLNPKVNQLLLGSDASKGGYGGHWGASCISVRFPTP